MKMERLGEKTKAELEQLREFEQMALQQAAEFGSYAFKNKELDRIAPCMREAIMHNRNVDRISKLLLDWNEISEIDELIEEVLLEGFALERNISKYQPLTLKSISNQLNCLLEDLLQIGAQAFTKMRFQLVHRTYKKVVIARDLLDRIEEMDAEGKESIKLVAAA